MDRSLTSAIDFFSDPAARVTARISGRSRAPLHTGHGMSRM
ncbi:Uncharacterised protein [Mycobacteroides abscessus subsp. abscessus]|nr:Uncharacterised protein [Mycobacteroides abscessus subsp. abscessus]